MLYYRLAASFPSGTLVDSSFDIIERESQEIAKDGSPLLLPQDPIVRRIPCRQIQRFALTTSPTNIYPHYYISVTLNEYVELLQKCYHVTVLTIEEFDARFLV